MIPNAWSGFDFGLGEEVEMLRKTVCDFAQDKIAPRADEIDRTNTFPRDLWPQMGELGLHGITVEEEYGGSGLGYLAHCVAMEEISRASASVGLVLRRAFQSVRQPDPPQRQRSAEEEISRQVDLRRSSRRVGDVGARRRVGRRLDADPRREERRPLRPQRLENVDHQRADSRHAGGLCQDRSERRAARHHCVPDRERA